MEAIFFFIPFGLVVWYAIVSGNNRKKEQQRLHDNYYNAIASGDKARALQCGRAYYGFLRKGKLTLYDEQAITNDLSTIK